MSIISQTIEFLLFSDQIQIYEPNLSEKYLYYRTFTKIIKFSKNVCPFFLKLFLSMVRKFLLVKEFSN